MLRDMNVPPAIRFLVVGGSAALLELGVFQLLVHAGVAPVPANVVSFAFGMTTSFLGYRMWTFAGDQSLPVAGQFGAYLALALFNAAATSALIHVLVSAGTIPWLAKAGCMVLVAGWNFLLLNRLIFRRRPATPSEARPTAEARVER